MYVNTNVDLSFLKASPHLKVGPQEGFKDFHHNHIKKIHSNYESKDQVGATRGLYNILWNIGKILMKYSMQGFNLLIKINIKASL